MNADKEKLAEKYAHNVLRSIAERGLIRTQRTAIDRSCYSAEFHSFMSDRWQEDAERFAADICEIHSLRRKGAAVKLANDRDGTQATKRAARDLWPEANRKGWTAAQFHTALTAAGHKVPFDSVRKWLTKLRKTGMC